MKKMKSLFYREGQPYLVQPLYFLESLWVAMGEGVATRKWDGTACMIRDGVLHCRRHKKFIPVTEDDPNCKWHREWLRENDLEQYPDGTYELCGPNIQGNPEHLLALELLRHGEKTYLDAPRTYDELKDWLFHKDIEGLVWHHPDGRMIKLKKKDFGLPRKP